MLSQVFLNVLRFITPTVEADIIRKIVDMRRQSRFDMPSLGNLLHSADRKSLCPLSPLKYYHTINIHRNLLGFNILEIPFTTADIQNSKET